MAFNYNKKINNSSDALRRIDKWFRDDNAGIEAAGLAFDALKTWIKEEEHREAARNAVVDKLVQIAKDYQGLIKSDYEGRNGITGGMKTVYDEVQAVIKEACE